MKRLDRAELEISVDIISHSYTIDNFEMEERNGLIFWCTLQSQEIQDNL